MKKGSELFDLIHAYLTRSPDSVTICRPLAVLLLLGVLGGSGISGCATSSPALSTEMTPQDLHLHRTHPHSVRVAVAGGQETDPKGFSQVSNKAFAQALEDAIRESSLFAELLRGPSADYLLEVRIIRLEQAKGFSMTARMTADWRLSRSYPGPAVWTDTIESSHTASAISSRKAVIRMQLATEGAARENIRRGMEKISRLVLE